MEQFGLEGGVFERQKDSVVLGTYETSAFILSLRDPDEFSSIHSFGYHRIPHVGVYGKDYSVSLPMVLLSLPATQRNLQNLPNELLGALDLDPFVTQTQHTQPVIIPSFANAAKPTTCSMEAIKENILTFQRIYLSSGMSLERIAAKAIVDLVIHSAQRRVAPPIFTFEAVGVQNGFTACPSTSSCSKHVFLSVDNSTNGMMEWRETRRASSGSFRGLKEEAVAGRSTSAISMDSQGYSTDCSDYPRTETQRHRVLFQVGEDQGSMSVETLKEVDEEELRVVAKKLVMKILHMACKEVESLCRRSSIEYLIASTKRMKIDESPSPPPVLFNIAEEEQDGADLNDGKIPNPFSDLRPSSSERSPTPEHLLLRRLGKKRGRSGSHEVSGLREFVESSRRSKVVRKIINFKDRLLGGGGTQQQQSGVSVKSPTRSNDDSSSQSGDEGSGFFSSLVSNLSRMTIGEPPAESDTESEATPNMDDSFTILSAVTISEDPLAGLRGESNSSCNGSKGFPFPFQEQTVFTRDHHQQSNHLGASPPFPTANNSTHNTPTNPLATQSSTQVNHTPRDVCNPVIPDMDLFVIVHSHPALGECQKFLCNNTDEVNLMYHCWMYPNLPFDPGMSVTGKLEMGIFEPSFVEPVHFDLQDAGIAFYFLDERTVCIHHCCFSPENAQLRLSQTPGHSPILHSFYSAARLVNRRVAAFHVIPSSNEAEQSIRECIHNCSSLGQLLGRLNQSFPDVGHKVLNLVVPQ